MMIGMVVPRLNPNIRIPLLGPNSSVYNDFFSLDLIFNEICKALSGDRRAIKFLTTGFRHRWLKFKTRVSGKVFSTLKTTSPFIVLRGNFSHTEMKVIQLIHTKDPTRLKLCD